MGGLERFNVGRVLNGIGGGLFVLVSAMPLQAQISTVIEAGGLRQELATGSVECVYDGTELRCTPASPPDGDPAESPPVAVTTLGFAITVVNVSNAPTMFQFIVSSPITPREETLIGGSVGGSVTDGNFDGSGGLSTVAGTPLYQAFLDNTLVASLHADPLAVPGAGFPGTFDFAGESLPLPVASFGLPGPSQVGPAVMSTFGVQFTFVLAAGDNAGFTSVLGVVGETNADTVAELPPAPAEPLAPGEVSRVIRAEAETLSSADVCPRLLSASLAIVNGSGANQSVMLTIVFPGAPIPMTVIGASISGSVTDTNFDGTGGFGTTMSNPVYVAEIDDSSVGQLYPAPFNLPGPNLPGVFTAAGETVALPAASFGFPGPATIGPPVTTSIGVDLQFTVAPRDAVSFTSLFVVDCPAEQGEECVSPSQCEPGLFCSDGVCCDSACDGFQERCDIGPDVGTCKTLPAPAPVASPAGILLLALVLLIVAGLTLLRSRRALSR